jgi:hypothetical protein
MRAMHHCSPKQEQTKLARARDGCVGYPTFGPARSAATRPLGATTRPPSITATPAQPNASHDSHRPCNPAPSAAHSNDRATAGSAAGDTARQLPTGPETTSQPASAATQTTASATTSQPPGPTTAAHPIHAAAIATSRSHQRMGIRPPQLRHCPRSRRYATTGTLSAARSLPPHDPHADPAASPRPTGSRSTTTPR